MVEAQLETYFNLVCNEYCEYTLRSCSHGWFELLNSCLAITCLAAFLKHMALHTVEPASLPSIIMPWGSPDWCCSLLQGGLFRVQVATADMLLFTKSKWRLSRRETVTAI
jgi:hypothetical protein